MCPWRRERTQLARLTMHSRAAYNREGRSFHQRVSLTVATEGVSCEAGMGNVDQEDGTR